ncbi:hypothetical protein N3Z11_04020 [Rheinheimera sp. 4Y26]|nr:hypothetical protein [Rheinheimera sp. 4Y26]
MYSRLSVAIALSLLLHLLLLALLLLQPAPVPAKNTAKSAPLTVQIINRPKPKAAVANSSKENIKAQATTTGTTAAENNKTNHSAAAAPIKKTAVPKNNNTTKTAATAVTAPKAKIARQQNSQQKTEPAKLQPDTAEAATVTPGLADRILATVATQQQQRATELSSAEIQALQQKALPDKAISVTRSGPKPAYAAANVLEVMKDGSFIEKIGDYCYQAKDGADLRRDIASMKPVSCGDDADAALYQSIMDKVGNHKP